MNKEHQGQLSDQLTKDSFVFDKNEVRNASVSRTISNDAVSSDQTAKTNCSQSPSVDKDYQDTGASISGLNDAEKEAFLQSLLFDNTGKLHDNALNQSLSKADIEQKILKLGTHLKSDYGSALDKFFAKTKVPKYGIPSPPHQSLGGGYQQARPELQIDQLLVSNDDEGDNDPEPTKLAVNLLPSEGLDPVSYRIGLKERTDMEIKVGIFHKQESSVVDCDKIVASQLNKCVWYDECEEKHNDINTFEDEENDEELAHVCNTSEETDDMTVESFAYYTDDDEDASETVTPQTSDTEENQDGENNEENEEDSTANDESSDETDNIGEVHVLSQDANLPQVAVKDNIIDVENTGGIGDHDELVGTDPTIISLDYMPLKSELVRKTSDISKEICETKHHLLLHNDTTMMIDGMSINQTVYTAFQDLPMMNLDQPVVDGNEPNSEGLNDNQIEQAEELLPLINPLLMQTPSLPSIPNNNSLYQFPQPEEPFGLLCNEVDLPVVADPFTEDTSSENLYPDAVEVHDDNCHQSSSFVSPPAENADNY